jgi:NitT/TauT family transport system ATP-binding protein
MEVTMRNLCKSYDGCCVLKDFSAVLRPGITALMGPSGIGKTTLVRILAGLERPDSGEISLPPDARISAVFQEDRLLEERTAGENLRFALGGNAGAAMELLHELGVSAPDDLPVREYSGGMKRRVVLARALGASFDLLLLDEPFAGLDAENRRRAADCIRRCSAGRPVLLVTHDDPRADGLDAVILTLPEQDGR